MCPRCKGQIVKDYYEHVCLQCGYSPADELFRNNTLPKLNREKHALDHHASK